MKFYKNNENRRSILSESFLSRMVQMRRCFFLKCTKGVHEEKNIKQMSRYAQEKGRSMVEMLGVLAIIGVLSVGGIAGYSKAMNKYKTNQTIDVLSQLFSNIILLDDKNMSYNGEIGGAKDMVNYGIMPDCDLEYTDRYGDVGSHCPLPNGGEVTFYWMRSEGSKTFGFVQIALTENATENCIAILSSGLHNVYLDDWWSAWDEQHAQPGSLAAGSTIVYSPKHQDTQYHNLSNAAIANACEEACRDFINTPGKACFVNFGIRTGDF